MQQKNKTVVVFEAGKAPRVHINPQSLSALQKLGPILVNPSIPKGIPPHEWKLVNGRIKAGLKIENVFPEDKSVDLELKWFRPLVLGLLFALCALNIYQEKQSIKKGYDQVRALISGP